jgi:HAD superfamily hydrolase (TIGR01450 family)
VSLADRFDAFLIDLDGVVWRGETPISGAADAIAALRECGKRVLFVTNNASRSARDYAAKLMRMHIPTEPADVVTSGHAVVAHLREMRLEPGSRVHVFGTAALVQLVRAAGFVVTADADDIEAVVVAWNPQLTFDDLARAADAARTGVPLIGANRDATYPAEDGLLPGTGAILAAIEVASGCRATVVGKPAPYLFTLALEQGGATAGRTLVIGDRADSDVAGAQAAGLPVALVLTGVTRPQDVGALSHEPDVVMDELADVLRDEAEVSSAERLGVPRSPHSVASSAERDDQDQAGEETADVREVRDAAAIARPLAEAGEAAE